MNKQLRILILEDDDSDAELMERELRKADIEFKSKRVKTKENFQKELFGFEPDIVLADYTLPSFDGCSALKIVKENHSDVPFIFVSGTIGEDFAIESLKSGATDYVIKDRMSRLVPAVRRALSEVKEKIEHAKAQKALKESELRFRSVVQSANDAIILTDSAGNIISWNKGAKEIFGYTGEEMTGRPITHIIHERFINEHQKKSEGAGSTGKSGRKIIESRGLRKDGTEFAIEISIATWKTEEERFYSAIIRDITERKKAEEILKEKARAELYGFVVSALPVFASGVPSQVRNILVKNFAKRFEENIRPRFEEEMKRHPGWRNGNLAIEHSQETLDAYMMWLLGLFSNLGIRTVKSYPGNKCTLELLNCPWKGEASGNPIFCLVCRTLVMRSFTWTSFKGAAAQGSSIANGSKTCVFEIHVISEGD
ncbi:Methyl sulfide methyltransferase-associated sensor [uncultured archaeon]|nr:Methyl sulfide methyltransferase-associated sensor [uncultured archaeon]